MAKKFTSDSKLQKLMETFKNHLDKDDTKETGILNEAPFTLNKKKKKAFTLNKKKKKAVSLSKGERGPEPTRSPEMIARAEKNEPSRSITLAKRHMRQPEGSDETEVDRPPEEKETIIQFHKRTGGRGLPIASLQRIKLPTMQRAMALIDEMDNSPALQEDPDFNAIRDNAIAAFRAGDEEKLSLALGDFESRKEAKQAEMMQSLEEQKLRHRRIHNRRK